MALVIILFYNIKIFFTFYNQICMKKVERFYFKSCTLIGNFRRWFFTVIKDEIVHCIHFSYFETILLKLLVEMVCIHSRNPRLNYALIFCEIGRSTEIVRSTDGHNTIVWYIPRSRRKRGNGEARPLRARGSQTTITTTPAGVKPIPIFKLRFAVYLSMRNLVVVEIDWNSKANKFD